MYNQNNDQVPFNKRGNKFRPQRYRNNNDNINRYGSDQLFEATATTTTTIPLTTAIITMAVAPLKTTIGKLIIQIYRAAFRAIIIFGAFARTTISLLSSAQLRIPSATISILFSAQLRIPSATISTKPIERHVLRQLSAAHHPFRIGTLLHTTFNNTGINPFSSVLERSSIQCLTI